MSVCIVDLIERGPGNQARAVAESERCSQLLMDSFNPRPNLRLAQFHESPQEVH